MKKLLPLLLCLFALPLHAAAPAPTSWSVDATKSTLEFSFVQAGARTTGRFGKFTAAIDFAQTDLPHARFDVAIDVASADTRDGERDSQLRSSDLFDAGKFPKAQFVVTQFSAKASAFEGLGKLTLRGVTRDVSISFTFQPATEAGQTLAWLKGTATVKRLDFGVGQGEWKSTDWVGNEVQVAFNLRLLPKAPTPVAQPAPAAHQ
jgi:polyisoprenoid-binding protein YceI